MAVVAEALRSIAPVLKLYVNEHNVAARRCYECVGLREHTWFRRSCFGIRSGQQSRGPGGVDRLNPVAGSELAHRVLKVCLGGGRQDGQLLGDLGVSPRDLSEQIESPAG